MHVCAYIVPFTHAHIARTLESVSFYGEKVLLSQLIPLRQKQPYPVWQSSFKNKNCYISRVHLCGSDKETNADLHFDYGRTIPTGISKCGVEGGGGGERKTGKSIAHFLLFCIGILMFAEIKVDKPERYFEPSQLEQP